MNRFTGFGEEVPTYCCKPSSKRSAAMRFHAKRRWESATTSYQREQRWKAVVQDARWKYDISYIARGKDDCVGSGAFGQVRPCVELSSRADRCVKSIVKETWWTRPAVVQEIELLEMVSGNHPNIVEYYECFEEINVIHLVLEYCSKGNLSNVILSKRFKEGGETLTAKISYQIAGALQFLRDLQIVHRDVKPGSQAISMATHRVAEKWTITDCFSWQSRIMPSNLVFAEDEVVKLTDFGCACLADDAVQDLTDIKGTPIFFSPEIHQLPRGRGYSFPADMWALGICIYMMLCKGAHPFMKEGGALRTRDHHTGVFDVDWFTSWSARDALQWALMPHPGQRIQPNELMEHKWPHASMMVM
ncbi:CPK31 [Symbiodinium microadriaticum]|nr:CPK31 [Symbiodinium microadriaticum]